MARGHFNPDINPRLLKLIEGMKYDKYKVNPTSGYRPGDKRQHGRGQAIDIQLEDPNTGATLNNYQDPTTFKAYQEYANTVYQDALKNDPELAKQLRWGGYFSGGKDKYGALDLMHFDTAGDIGMAGGSWEGGLSPEQAKIWGLDAGGGISNAQVQQIAQATGQSPDAVRKAFLASISSTESPGYDVMYGGEKFSDFSHHPGRDMPIMKDGQVVGHSSAAGKYQFLKDTWAEQQAKYGYKDFSPETQDTAAWNYANDIFMKKTGGSLEEALQSGDAGRINAAAQVLNQTWTSLPGGKEQSKGYGTQTFADVYNKALGSGAGGAGGGTSVHPPNPTVGTGGFVAPGANTTPVPENKAKAFDYAKFMKDFTGGMGDMGSAASPMASASGISDLPRAVLAPGTPTTYGAPGEAQAAVEDPRAKLARIMAQLNSQKLFV
jgi:muramidase (phage lysozyme)